MCTNFSHTFHILVFFLTGFYYKFLFLCTFPSKVAYVCFICSGIHFRAVEHIYALNFRSLQYFCVFISISRLFFSSMVYMFIHHICAGIPCNGIYIHLIFLLSILYILECRTHTTYLVIYDKFQYVLLDLVPCIYSSLRRVHPNYHKLYGRCTQDEHHIWLNLSSHIFFLIRSYCKVFQKIYS